MLWVYSIRVTYDSGEKMTDGYIYKLDLIEEKSSTEWITLHTRRSSSVENRCMPFGFKIGKERRLVG